MKITEFLFDSIYQVLTWVFIALAVGGIYHFWSKGNIRGVLWSVVALIVFVTIMIGIIAERYLPERTDATSGQPSDRAWLNVELFPSGPVYYLPQQAELCAFFPVKFRVTNTGRSPATDIQIRADVFFGRFKEEPKERQRKIVSLASWKGHPFRPDVVFPATSEEFTMTWVKPISQMKQAGINPGAPTIEQVKHFDAYIGGCIRYTSGGKFPGETGFLYEINVPSPTGGNIVPEIGKEIPLERLAFRRYFPGGGEWAT